MAEDSNETFGTVIRCATQDQFDRLSLQSIADADKVVVAGRVVKDRDGPTGVLEGAPGAQS